MRRRGKAAVGLKFAMFVIYIYVVIYIFIGIHGMDFTCRFACLYYVTIQMYFQHFVHNQSFTSPSVIFYYKNIYESPILQLPPIFTLSLPCFFLVFAGLFSICFFIYGMPFYCLTGVIFVLLVSGVSSERLTSMFCVLIIAGSTTQHPPSVFFVFITIWNDTLLSYQ